MLPLYYSSILEEHKAVRTGVGLFDVSHLAHLQVSGPGLPARLSPLVTQDLGRVDVGRACYTPVLNSEGHILDEMIFYRLTPDSFRLVVNAANGDKILGWLESHLPGTMVIEDLRQRFGTLAVQGPKATAVLERLSGESFNGFPRYAVRPGKMFGCPLFVARTGYTGEDGGELFVPVERLEAVWNGLLDEAKDFGIKPIGLGARDTLRLEAGLPLGGSDLDETTTPLEAGLEWTVSWEKGPFMGREALERQKKSGLARLLVGFEVTGAGIPRHGYPIKKEGVSIGRVTSGTLSPILNKGIGMGYVPPQFSQPGAELMIEIHGRSVPAQVVRLPFYRRKKS